MDDEVRENAGKQLSIMLATGDKRLHKAFINSDGVNFCIRYLKKACFSTNVPGENFLQNLNATSGKFKLTKLAQSCVTCLCEIIYWNKDVRSLYLFEMDFFKLVIKLLFLTSSFNAETQEELSIILFILLFNQVSSLDFYYSEASNANTKHLFTLSQHLKELFHIPFNTNSIMAPKKSECQLKSRIKANAEVGNASFMSNCSISNSSISVKAQLEAKFRIAWNQYWHGGSLDALLAELCLYEVDQSSREFNLSLRLSECDKLLLSQSNAKHLFKNLCANLSASLTHQDALSSLHMIQLFLSIYGNQSSNRY